MAITGGGGAPVDSPAFTGSPTAPTQGALDNSTKLGTTAYSDAAVLVEKTRALAAEAGLSAGMIYKAAVQWATTAALPANVYGNGASGVGATLTGVALGALSVDGNTPAPNDRLLVKNEAAPANNGFYLVTAVGSVGAAYVLTRTADYNQPAEIQNGDVVGVLGGATNANTAWVMTTSGAVTVGTTAITWSPAPAGVVGTAGQVIVTGNVVSLSPAVVSESGAAAGNLGATATFDFGGRRRGFESGTLNANCVVTASNLVAGSQGWLLVTQDASGGWTLGISDGTTTQPVSITGAAGGTSLVRIYSIDGTAILVEVAGGPTGPRGSGWWAGTGAPTTVAGALANDFYVNKTNGEVYKSTAGPSTWADQGFSIQGPTGLTGPTGPTGPAASDASTTVKGVSKLSVAPVSGANPIVVGDNDLRFNVPARLTRDAWRPTNHFETFPRWAAMTNIGALSSGRLAVQGGLILPAGVPINTIRVWSGTTAAGTPLNQWFCLLDQSRSVLVKTVDDTTTAWAANTGKPLATAATYTPANDIAVYVGVVVVATTVPSLTGINSANAGAQAAGINNTAPILCGLSTSGLTDPTTLGATAAALSADGAMFYAEAY